MTEINNIEAETPPSTGNGEIGENAGQSEKAAVAHLKPRTLGEFVVTATVEGFETMEFLFTKQLAKDKRNNRQQWLGMTEEEEKDRLHEVRVMSLAELLRAEPVNVPEWKINSDPISARFVKYFSDDEYYTFIEQLEVLYLKKLYPVEYSKQRSE